MVAIEVEQHSSAERQLNTEIMMMVQKEMSTEEKHILWLVKSKKKERLQAKDLTEHWEKAPTGSKLLIGEELVAVKE